MKNTLSLIALSLLILTGCGTTTQTETKPVSYDQNSWKEIIPETCQSFSDGCNNCRRMEGSEVAACTKKACQQYTKPVCLDEAKEESPYIGLSVEEAQAKAKESDTLFRVVEIDGEPQPATMDYRPGRINAATKDGKVISLTIE